MNINGINSASSSISFSTAVNNETPSHTTDTKLAVPLKGRRKEIFQRLYNKGVIDEKGLLTEHFKYLSPPPISSEKIQAYLEKEIAEGKKTRIIDLLRKIPKIKNVGNIRFRLIGGFLRWIMVQDPTYFKEAFKEICNLDDLIDEKLFSKQLTPPQDFDLQILVPNCSDADFPFLIRDIMGSIGFKVTIKKKKHAHFDGENHYGVLTLGIPNTPDLELLVIKKLKRLNIFVHEDLRADLTDVINGENPSKVEVETLLGLQPLIDQLTGLIHTQNVEEIDHNGWPKFIGEITRGKNCWEENTETILRETAKKRGHEGSFLIKNLENHSEKDPDFALSYLFNASVFAGKILERKAIKEIKGLEDDGLLHTLQKLLNKKKSSLKTVLAYLNVASFIALGLPGENQCCITLLNSGGKRTIRINRLHFPLNVKEAIEQLLEKGNSQDFQSIFKRLLKGIDFKSQGKSIIEKVDILEQVEKLLETKQWRTLGFQLLCILQTLDPNASHIEKLCLLFPRCGTLPWMQLALRHSTFAPVEKGLCSNKPWIIRLASTQDRKLCAVAYSLWKSGDKISGNFCQKLLPASPELALKVFQKLEDTTLFLKILNASKHTHTELEDTADRLIKKRVRLNQFPELFKLLQGINKSKILTRKNVIQTVSEFDFSTLARCVTDPQSPFQHNPLILIKSLEKIDGSTIKNNFSEKCKLLQVAVKSASHKESEEVVKHLVRILEIIKKKNLLLSNLLKTQLKVVHEDVVSYLKEQNLVVELHTFVHLLLDLHIKKSFSERVCSDYLWSLSSTPKLSKKTLAFLKDTSNFQKTEDKSTLQKVLTLHGESLHNENQKASFFREDLPIIYGKGFESTFSKPVSACIQNVKSKKVAFQLLSKYKISEDSVWIKLLKKTKNIKKQEIQKLVWETSLKGLHRVSKHSQSECWKLAIESFQNGNTADFFKAILSFLGEIPPPLRTLTTQDQIEITEQLFLNSLTHFEKSELPQYTMTHVKLLRNELCRLKNIKPNSISRYIDLPFFDTLINSHNQAVILWVMKELGTLSGTDFVVLLPTITSLLKAYRDHPELHQKFVAQNKSILHELSGFSKERYHTINSLFKPLSQSIILLLSHPPSEESPETQLIPLLVPILIDFGSIETSQLPYFVLTWNTIEARMGKEALGKLWTRFMEAHLEKKILTAVNSSVPTLQFFLANERKLSKDLASNALCYKWVTVHLANLISKNHDEVKLTAQVKDHLWSYANSIGQLDQYKILLTSYLTNSAIADAHSAEHVCHEIFMLFTETLESSPESTEELFPFIAQFLVIGKLYHEKVHGIFLKYAKKIIETIHSKNYFDDKSGVYLIALMIFNDIDPTAYFDADSLQENQLKSIVKLIITLLQSDATAFWPVAVQMLETFQLKISTEESSHHQNTYQLIFNEVEKSPELLKIAASFLDAMYLLILKFVHDLKNEKVAKNIFELWEKSFIRICLKLITTPHCPHTASCKPKEDLQDYPYNTEFVLTFLSTNRIFNIDFCTNYEFLIEAIPFIISDLNRREKLDRNPLVMLFTQLIISQKPRAIQPHSNQQGLQLAEILHEEQHLKTFQKSICQKTCAAWIKALHVGGCEDHAKTVFTMAQSMGSISKNLKLSSILNPTPSSRKKRNRRKKRK